MKQYTPTTYQLFSILSIDVVIGTLIGAAFSSRLLGVHPDVWFYVILALSVWILYTADHLVDARRLKEKAHTQRHLFHHTHFKVLTVLVGILAMGDFLLVLMKLSQQIIFAGFILFIITAVYFGALSLLKSRKSILLQKEFIVALVYTAGVWIGPLALRNYKLLNTEILFLIGFFMIVWSVVLLYSAIEYEEDRIDGHQTLATRIGVSSIQRLIYGIVLLVIIAVVYLIITSPVDFERRTAKLFLMMALIVGIMNAFPEFFKYNYRYRYIGEMIFWLPVLLLI